MDSAILTQIYGQVAVFHSLFWPTCTLIGGTIIIAMVKLTQYLSIMSERLNRIKRWRVGRVEVQREVPLKWTRGQLKRLHGAKPARQRRGTCSCLWQLECWDSRTRLSDNAKAATKTSILINCCWFPAQHVLGLLVGEAQQQSLNPSFSLFLLARQHLQMLYNLHQCKIMF